MSDEFLSTSWWRYDRYEVDRLYIRPAPGARLRRYDPWQENTAALARWRDHEPPYITLARLGDEYDNGLLFGSLSKRTSAVSGVNYVGADEKLLEAVGDWCSRYGLLGVLLTGLQAFTTAARYRPEAAAFWGESARDLPTTRTFELTAGQWRLCDTILSAPWLGRPTAATGELLDQEVARKAFSQEPGLPGALPEPGLALRRNYHSFGAVVSWRLQPLDNWAAFFPDLDPREAATFDYPAPLSEAFGRLYAEPLEVFLHHARIFAVALRNLKHPLPPVGAAMTAEPDAYLETLRRLLAFVTPDLRSDPDHPERLTAQWSSPSLLSTLAFMAYRDLTGGGRVGFCRRNACGKVFLARRADQEYCSPRCKATAKKRYQRHPEIAQEAIRLSKQGLSVAQIADVLLLSEKRVAAWIESDAREDERSTERDHQSGGQ
jgi:hypothetical protein